MSSTITPTASSSFVAANYKTSPDFEGWYLQTTPEPILCAATQTYYTSSTYADCYDPSSSVPIPTGCDGSTLLRGDESGVCDTAYSCGSYKIFPTEGSDESEAVLRYGCLVNWAADSIYRTLPARYASSTAAHSVTDTGSSTNASPTPTTQNHPATNTNTAADAQNTTGTATGASNSGNGLSGGVIGGIVVGCIAAVAILALLIFRKKIMALFGKGKPSSEAEPAWAPV